MTNPFGISDKTYTLLIETFSKKPEIEEVIIFGSRAKGNFKKGSDIDLAIKTRTDSPRPAFELKAIINETLPIPYMVDIVDYNFLQHKELKEHIDRVGVIFYKKTKSNLPAISKHLKNIFQSGELQENSVISKMETTACKNQTNDKTWIEKADISIEL